MSKNKKKKKFKLNAQQIVAILLLNVVIISYAASFMMI